MLDLDAIEARAEAATPGRGAHVQPVERVGDRSHVRIVKEATDG